MIGFSSVSIAAGDMPALQTKHDSQVSSHG
jgi:hypothetical protein